MVGGGVKWFWSWLKVCERGEGQVLGLWNGGENRGGGKKRAQGRPNVSVWGSWMARSHERACMRLRMADE